MAARVVVTTALLGAAVASGCSTSVRADAPSGTAAPPGRPLTVVGDSLVVLGRDPVRERLTAAGWDVQLDAYPGRTTGQQLDALAALAADPGRTVIVELGTNDAIQLATGRLDAARAASDIAAALDLFAGRCVVWVNPDRDPQRLGADAGATIGQVLAAEAARRPELHVADLAAVLAAHPEHLLDDQVHLTDSGSTALADLMVATVAACA